MYSWTSSRFTFTILITLQMNITFVLLLLLLISTMRRFLFNFNEEEIKNKFWKLFRFWEVKLIKPGTFQYSVHMYSQDEFILKISRYKYIFFITACYFNLQNKHSFLFTFKILEWISTRITQISFCKTNLITNNYFPQQHSYRSWENESELPSFLSSTRFTWFWIKNPLK